MSAWAANRSNCGAFSPRMGRRFRKRGFIAWTTRSGHRPRGSETMCATLSASISSDEAVGPGWSAAESRVRAYLGAAGLEDRIAGALAREVVAGCATNRPQLAEDEAILVSLRSARRLLTDKSARDRELRDRVSLAPRDQPLSIRRRAFRSIMDWRLAASRLRRLLPARAPQRVRRIADGID